MKESFKQKCDGDQICLRKVIGALCAAAGVLVILFKVFWFAFTGVQIPFDGRGQYLVGAGCILLGATGFDGLISSFSRK